MNNVLPRNALLTIYKSFVRPHSDNGDILYHQPNNESKNSKLESVQYSTALAITGAIKGTSRSKLYKELGLESLKSRRTFRHLCSFHKIISTGLPTYLFNLIPKSTHGYQTRTSQNIPTYQCRTDTFKHYFSPWTIVTWNEIHKEARNTSLTVFKKHLLKEICPVPHLVYNICNPNGLKLLPRLKLGFSHLNKHRFNHNFESCINPLCTCILELESTSYFFWHSHYYDSIRHKSNELFEVDNNLPNASDEKLVNILLYGCSIFSYSQNQSILNLSIKYIIDSNHFSGSIF